MEPLFSRCIHRLWDLLDPQGYLDDFEEEYWDYLEGEFEHFQELNLDVSIDELLSAARAFTYADLYAMLGNEDTMAWLTPHASLVRADGRAALCSDHVPYFYKFTFNVDGKYIDALASSREHLLEICDVIFRLVAVSVVHRVILDGPFINAVSVVHSYNFHDWECSDGTFINARTFAYLMEECQSLKVLSLVNLDMDENHCALSGACSRPDLEIVLDGCRITDGGASALAEVLGRNQGPTKLSLCKIDNLVVADGLRGNSRLKSLRPRLSSSSEDGKRDVLAIAGALKENKGLVDLDLCHDFTMNYRTWNTVCDSLKTHPTLEVLDLHTSGSDGVAILAPSVITSRIQALLDMLKVNTSIHTLSLNAHYSEHELFRESVIPNLETNRFRPRLLAIQRTRHIPYRAKVLGRALFAIRNDPNRFWMLLSGNIEVAFP
jgi:hypothetical protein